MADEDMFDERNLDAGEINNPTLSTDLQDEIGELLSQQADGSILDTNDIEQLKSKSENAELKDQNLRLVADMENLRRRTLRDVADAKTYAVANFARDMLNVLDNLARALEVIAPDVRENDSHLNALAEGVEMTSRAMVTALESHGVKKIEAADAKFDPHIHQAMFERRCSANGSNFHVAI